MPVPNIFAAGDQALADDVNENFDYLDDLIAAHGREVTIANGADEAIAARDVVFVEDSTLTDLTLLQISPSGSFDGSSICGGTGSLEMSAQSFTESGALRIVKITVAVRKQGTPSDDFVVALQADAAGVPSGTDLATASLAGGSISGTFSDKTFTMSSIITTTAATKYWVVFRRSGSRDLSNYFAVAYNNGAANSYANGGKADRDTGVWTTSTTDLNVKLLDQTIEGKVYRASDSAEYTKGVVGFAKASAAKGADITFYTFGIVTGFSGLSRGKPYYVDSNGAISTSTGTQAKKVGVAITTTTLLIVSN